MDLAGSEKFSIPKKISKEERDFRIQELTSINGSLSALGHCITALTDSKRTHIPFRSSKLTRFACYYELVADNQFVLEFSWIRCQEILGFALLYAYRLL